jgi:flavin-binding protein dodecin
VIGSSPESFAKAGAAVQEAARTVRGISGARVTSMKRGLGGDRISQYPTVDIAFAVERQEVWRNRSSRGEQRSGGTVDVSQTFKGPLAADA